MSGQDLPLSGHPVYFYFVIPPDLGTGLFWLMSLGLLCDAHPGCLARSSRNKILSPKSEILNKSELPKPEIKKNVTYYCLR